MYVVEKGVAVWLLVGVEHDEGIATEERSYIRMELEKRNSIENACVIRSIHNISREHTHIGSEKTLSMELLAAYILTVLIFWPWNDLEVLNSPYLQTHRFACISPCRLVLGGSFSHLLLEIRSEVRNVAFCKIKGDRR